MAPKSDKKQRGFSGREVRALLWLLPALAVASWLVWEVSRTVPEVRDAENNTLDGIFSPSESDSLSDPAPLVNALSTPDDGSDDSPTPQLFAFDPNTVEYHDLVRLGFSRGEALGIIKYRERGKVFEIPEDFAACYQVSEDMYLRLKSCITIGEEFRLKKFEGSSTAVFSQKGAEVTPTEGEREGMAQNVQPRPSGGEVRRAPVFHEKPLLDLNTADSAALIGVSGIGERTVVGIMEYRARLGGFAAVEQLAEVRGVTQQNYERIITQIHIDPAVIQKIDINFASAKILAAHPYIRSEALRKLLKHRQLKGGWRTPQELETDDIFTAEELSRLGPYLIFN